VGDGASGSWVQLIVPENRRPTHGSVFAHSLQHAGGYTPKKATRVAATLLPDVLPYQPGRQASYPRNGRALTDDAVAHFLTVLTNGKVTGRT
jgi:hypothetical protein